MMDHPDPELLFLTYDVSPSGFPSLCKVHHESLYQRSPRPAEYFNDVLVDSAGSLAVVSCYAGKLKFLLLKNGHYHSNVDLSCVTYSA